MGRPQYTEHPDRRPHLILARERKNLSRQEFADQLGVSREYVYRVEEGLRNPSYKRQIEWVNLLSTSMDYFRILRPNIDQAAE